MAFEGLKKKFAEFKEDVQFKRDVKQSLQATDVIAREQARAQAKQDFLQSREGLLQGRQQAFLEQERQKLQAQEQQLLDTRTGGQKFKEGVQKLGEKAQQVGARVTTDVPKIGRNIGTPDVSQFGQTVQKGLIEQPVQQTSKQNVFFGKNEQVSLAKQNMKFQQQQLGQKLNQGQGVSSAVLRPIGAGQGLSNVLRPLGADQGLANSLRSGKPQKKKSLGTFDPNKLRKFL